MELCLWSLTGSGLGCSFVFFQSRVEKLPRNEPITVDLASQSGACDLSAIAPP